MARLWYSPSDLGMRGWRVRADSLVLLISSIDAPETRLEAALHRPRARAAARRVVGVAQTTLFDSSDALRVLLTAVDGGLGSVGALRDGRVDQGGRLLVPGGRVWCQYRTWDGWEAVWSV